MLVLVIYAFCMQKNAQFVLWCKFSACIQSVYRREMLVTIYVVFIALLYITALCRRITLCAMCRTTPSTGWRWNIMAWRRRDSRSRLLDARCRLIGRFAAVSTRRQSRGLPPLRLCRHALPSPSRPLPAVFVHTVIHIAPLKYSQTLLWRVRNCRISLLL